MIKVQHLNICILLCSLLSCKSEEFNEGQTKLQMEEYLYIIEDVNESLLVNSPFYSLEVGDTLFFKNDRKTGVLELKKNSIGVLQKFTVLNSDQYILKVKYSNDNLFQWNFTRSQYQTFDKVFEIDIREETLKTRIKNEIFFIAKKLN